MPYTNKKSLNVKIKVELVYRLKEGEKLGDEQVQVAILQQNSLYL